ncbi:MAG: class I SAM-dependent methyltransferase [Anderseniella sp.]
MFARSVDQKNVIHFAPEPFLAPSFQRNSSLNYLASDPHPTRYKWVRRLCLTLPDDLRVFQDGYFDYILHNHMLEHLPGHWCDHLEEFKRLLAPSGQMIFSLPGPIMSQLTEEGGEHLSSDEERTAKFGQHDHFRQFGSDLITCMQDSEGMQFEYDDVSDAERERLNVGTGKDRLMIWTKVAPKF